MCGIDVLFLFLKNIFPSLRVMFAFFQYARIIQKLGFPAKFKVCTHKNVHIQIQHTHQSPYGSLFLGFDCCYTQFFFSPQDFKIQNIVGSCDVKFPIRLEGLAYSHGAFSSVSDSEFRYVYFLVFIYKESLSNY